MDHPVETVRTQILVEATRLFAARGFAGASLQHIAEAVGITKPTLLYHHGSKEELYDAVLDALILHWRDELPRLMTAAAGGPRVDGLLGAFHDYFAREPDRARLLLREALDRPDALRARLREHVQPWTGLLTQAMYAGQAQGVVRPGVDPEAFSTLVIAATLGLAAAGAAASALVAPEPDAARQRAELLRVARLALLTPP